MMPARTPIAASTRFALALVAIIAFAACDSTTGPGQDPPDEMLFLSSRTGTGQGAWSTVHKDIFRVDVQGTGAVNLTSDPAEYRSLSLSADGSTVAYIRLTDCYATWVMNIDGSNARQVAGFDPFRCVHRPRISPDGSMIAMTSSRILPGEPGGWRIWVMNSSGANAAEVSSSLGTSSWMWGWSPGGRVVFHTVAVAATGTSLTAYIVDPDGSNLQPFFDRSGDHSPSWSPDGSRMAFLSDREGSTDVYVMNANGTNVQRITTLPGDASFEVPTNIYANAVSPWSPDGTQIAFLYRADSTSPSRTYSVRADGTDLTPLSAELLNVQAFNGWSPSGRSIAYTVNGLNLYVADANGTNSRNLTTGGWQDGHALWLPRR
jgi:Tol biopolymer transport system component